MDNPSNPLPDSIKHNLNTTLRLKIASMILFWFGVILESITLGIITLEYTKNRTLFNNGIGADLSNSFLLSIFIFETFGHIIHIVTGYWLAKGMKKGFVLGLFVAFYESIPAFVLNTGKTLTDPPGIALRILFGIVILLIVFGRNELGNLKSENWRPWKNPLKITTKEGL